MGKLKWIIPVVLISYLSGFLTCWDLGQPGRISDSSGIGKQWLQTAGERKAEAVCRSAFPDYENMKLESSQILLEQKLGDSSLLLVRANSGAHVWGWGNLAAGVWNESKNCLEGQAFGIRGDGGDWKLWQEGESFRLLMTNSTINQGWVSCAGLLLLEFDGRLKQVTEIPQCARDSGLLPRGTKAEGLLYPAESSGRAGRYWKNLLAETEIGGIRLYRRAPGWNLDSLPENQWEKIGWVPLSEKTEAEKLP